MLSNPPFGVSWKKERAFIEEEAQSPHGRFSAGTPRVSDGALLFLQHMLSKMEARGCRLAIVFNGSPLFTGDAGGGESEIRRWIIENDWLEAIVALPTEMFYNTGISTYVWVLTNRKPERRQGTVQLIDASGVATKMRKSLGNKRNYLTDAQIEEVVGLYTAFQEGERVRLFPNEAFGYTKVRVERPQRTAKGEVKRSRNGEPKPTPSSATTSACRWPTTWRRTSSARCVPTCPTRGWTGRRPRGLRDQLHPLLLPVRAAAERGGDHGRDPGARRGDGGDAPRGAERMTPSELLRELNEADEGHRIEAKRASQIGKSVMETVSAFSNTPGLGGGYLLLGASATRATWSARYVAEGVPDPDKVSADLATQCASMLNAQVRPVIEREEIDGRVVVSAFVPEAAPDQASLHREPRAAQGAYLRVGTTDQQCRDADLTALYQARSFRPFDGSLLADTTRPMPPLALANYRRARKERDPGASTWRSTTPSCSGRSGSCAPTTAAPTRSPSPGCCCSARRTCCATTSR